MTAIEAGEAIVTGAVEITPLQLIYYTTVETVDLDAKTNAATTATGGLSVGVEVDGFDPTDIVRVSMPAGGTYIAWSPWGVPSPAHGTVPQTGSANQFNVIPGGVAADMFQVGDGASPTPYDGFAAARAAFGTHTFTGASSYTFYINDNPISDNTGGVSILVERGVSVGDTDPVRLWGGYGPITIGGNEFQGVGARGLAQRNAGAIGGVAQGITLSLSGIEPAALALLDGPALKNASVVLYRLIFASDGKTLLDAHVFDRGRVDTVSADETIGKDAAINVAVESAARGLGRNGSRMRADSDQRLIVSNDGYFKNTAYAGQKTLYWGGKKPAVSGGAVVGGTGGTGGGAGSAFLGLNSSR